MPRRDGQVGYRHSEPSVLVPELASLANSERLCVTRYSGAKPPLSWGTDGEGGEPTRHKNAYGISRAGLWPAPAGISIEMAPLPKSPYLSSPPTVIAFD